MSVSFWLLSSDSTLEYNMPLINHILLQTITLTTFSSRIFSNEAKFNQSKIHFYSTWATVELTSGSSVDFWFLPLSFQNTSISVFHCLSFFFINFHFTQHCWVNSCIHNSYVEQLIILTIVWYALKPWIIAHAACVCVCMYKCMFVCMPRHWPQKNKNEMENERMSAIFLWNNL